MIYDNILGTIGRTPIVRINRLAPQARHDVREVRVLQPAVLGQGPPRDRHHRGCRAQRRAQARARRWSKPPRAIPASRSPWYAPPRVIPSSRLMAETFSVERRKIMRMLGAKVILTPAAERGSGMVRKAAELAQEARLVPRAPVREPGQPRLSPQHHRPGNPPGLRRQASRLLRHRLGHGRHAHRRGRDDPARASGHARSSRRSRQARRCSAASRLPRTRSRAGRRTSCRRCSSARSRTASSRSPTSRRSRTHARCLPRKVSSAASPRAVRSPRRSKWPREARRGFGDPGHAAGHRRALSLDAAVRRHRRRRRSRAVSGPKSGPQRFSLH